MLAITYKPFANHGWIPQHARGMFAPTIEFAAQAAARSAEVATVVAAARRTRAARAKAEGKAE